ncbi:major facilitator superfamily domain-containing protein [Aspergillus keveii]|uniref:Major facilitator superfamily domain-containing protein n=1 Tax=Aspergillus keveii TaxID=714993 RepID=A0ABR4GHX9_9EURO
MLGTSARRVRWTLKVASRRGGLHPLGSTDSILRTHSGDQNSQSPHLSEDIGLAPVGHDAKAPADSGGGDHRQSIESVEKPDFAPAWKVTVIMVGLGLAVLCMALDNTILATAIPRITSEFNSLDDMGWYASAYLLTQCSMTLVFGKLYTFYVVKWVYLTALMLFEVGSLICGVASNSITLIMGRAVAGMGGAGLLVGSFLIVAVITPLDKRPIYNAILSSIYGVAGAVGPLLGGAFTDYVSWRWCFYINLPIGGVTAFFVLLFFQAEKASKARGPAFQQFLELDLSGLWGGAKYPWNSWRITTLLVAVGALLLVFAAIEYWQQDRAIIPPSLIKSRNIWGSVVFVFCITGSFIVFTYYLPIWFQSVKGASATMSGVMNLPLILSVTITSMLAGWAVTSIGYYTPFMYAAPVLAAVGAGLLSTFHVHSSHAAWIGYQALFGIGIGLGIGLPVVVVQAVLTQDRVSSGTALITFMQSIAGALFNFVAQSVFQAELMHSLVVMAPGLDADRVLEIGASGLRDLVAGDVLPVVLEAYNSAVMHAFYVGVALAAAAVIGAVPLRWLSVKGRTLEPGAM